MHQALVITMLVLCTSIMSLSQQVIVKGSLGASYYQGDLAPLPVALSLSEGNASWSLSVGTKLSNVFKIHGRFTIGKLIGDDAQASSVSRKARNLSFQSPLREYAVITDVNLNHWLKGLDQYGLQLYYSTGIAVFTFDPQAIIQNEAIRLQPLGTEGQGLPGYGDYYSLTQLSIPFGLGLAFDLSARLQMGFEVVPRVTFTDYIDDVSTIYPGEAVLMDANRTLAARLSDRSGELGSGGPRYEAGSMRGDSNDNDWYVIAGVSLSYTFGAIQAVAEPSAIDPLLDDEQVEPSTKLEE